MESHDWYLREAYDLAALSTDRSTQNGAIIVRPETGEIIGYGFNSVHHNFEQHDERFQRPSKYDWTEHAERAAIYDAAKLGHSTNGAWMFCAWAACKDCARAIVYSGITCLVRYHHPGMAGHHSWSDSILIGDQMMYEARIQVSSWLTPIGKEILFDGKKICV